MPDGWIEVLDKKPFGITDTCWKTGDREILMNPGKPDHSSILSTNGKQTYGRLSPPRQARVRFIPMLLILSGLHGVTAVLAYCLYAYIYPVTFSNTLMLCAVVVVPYGLLLIAHSLVRGLLSKWIVVVITMIVASVGNIVYVDAFEVRTRPDMFAAGLFVVALLQSVLAILALAAICWRRRALMKNEIPERADIKA